MIEGHRGRRWTDHRNSNHIDMKGMGMKVPGLAIFFLLLAGALWWLISYAETDQGRIIAMAGGNANEQGLEINLAITLGMIADDPPNLGPDGKRLWGKWVEEHFELHDSDSTKVEMRRLNMASAIPATKLTGAEQMFLSARVRPGIEHTIHFTPSTTEPTVYQHVFTVDENLPFKRVRFNLVR